MTNSLILACFSSQFFRLNAQQDPNWNWNIGLIKSCNEILLFPLSYFDLRWGPKNGLNARSPLMVMTSYLKFYFLDLMVLVNVNTGINFEVFKFSFIFDVHFWRPARIIPNVLPHSILESPVMIIQTNFGQTVDAISRAHKVIAKNFSMYTVIAYFCTCKLTARRSITSVYVHFDNIPNSKKRFPVLFRKKNPPYLLTI